jgi:hypothetical protein
MKIAGIGHVLLDNFCDTIIDMVSSHPNALVKSQAIEFFQIALMVFPTGLASKLSLLRDITR